jgi:group I intron endonuclease
MKEHYVYITTNLITGKQYIGDHTITLNERCHYIGSGKPYLKNAIKKYQRKNFFKEILEWFETRQEAFDAQERYINQFNTLFPNGYNLHPKGGYTFLNGESLDKMKDAKKGISPWNKGIKLSDEQLKPYLGRTPWNKGKTGLQHHSDKAKDKIRAFRQSIKKPVDAMRPTGF